MLGIVVVVVVAAVEFGQSKTCIAMFHAPLNDLILTGRINADLMTMQIPTKKGARDTDFSIESMGVGPWWIRCSNAEERHAWVACIRMIIGRGSSLPAPGN